MASNSTVLPDEDGDFSDWIEISNPTDDPIDLGGYHLTDKAQNPKRWTFPRIILQANSKLIVFASGKDRADPQSPLHTDFELYAKGEYLALVSNDGKTVLSEFSPVFPNQNEDQSYGTSSFTSNIPEYFISDANEAHYIIPTKQDELPNDWNQLNPSFNLNSWQKGRNGLGWESNNGTLTSLVRTNLRDQMRSVNASGFFRFEFNFSPQDRELKTLLLKTRVDDGYVAYLNGVQVASFNSPSPTTWNSKASRTGRSDSDIIRNQSEHDLTSQINLVKEGKNVLSIQAMNSSVSGSDFVVDLELVAGMAKSGQLYAGYFDKPTPNAPNSEGKAAGPMLQNYTRKPERPEAGKDLKIEATLIETNASVSSVKLFYRTMFDEEKSTTMTETEEGSGIYQGIIPGSSYKSGEMIRWRYEAEDELGFKTSEPPFLDPKDSHQYVGTVATDPSVNSKLSVVEMFLRSPGAAGTVNGTRGAIFYLGELYDNVFFSRHGQSTGGFVKKSYNIDFNRTQRFKSHPDEKRKKDIDLLTNWADKSKSRHVLAWEVMRESGVHAHFAFTVRVQQNGEFFSTADFVEDADDIYLERAGLNPDGALYKVYSNTLSSGDSGNSGVEKKNRKYENNQDLTDFIRGINNGNTAQQWEFIYDNVNLPMCINMAAANCVIRNTDMHRKNWYIYRDTGKSDEWALLPWDLDLSHGRKWNGSDTYFDNKLFSTDVIRVGTAVSLIQKMWANPEVNKMLMRRIRTLTDKFLNHPDTPYEDRYYERRLDEQLALIDPSDISPSDARLDFMKWGSWRQSSGSPVSYTSNHPDIEDMSEGVERFKNEYLIGRRAYMYGRSANLPEAQSGQISYDFKTLIESGSPSKTKIPSDDSDTLAWTDLNFDDSQWISGETAIGFDSSPKYKPLIGTDTRDAMRRINATAYIRIAFDVEDPKEYQKLKLLMKHDDGFIAYINGQRVAEKNAPEAPAWDSSATTNSGEADVNEFEVFDVSKHLNSLKEGANVLAIHGLNGSTGSSDFLIMPELHAGTANSNGSNEPKIEFGAIEFNPNSFDQDEEFIELKNPNDIAVDISDWRITNAVDLVIPPGTVIPADGVLFLSPNVKKFRARAESPRGGESHFVVGNYGGHLSNRGETIKLIDSNGRENNSITYQGQASLAQLHLAITKIHYHPQSDGLAEYIELMNTDSEQPLNLEGISFTEGIEFDFDNSPIKSLGPNQKIYIVRDKLAFVNAYGDSFIIAGAFENGTALGNEGETVKLEDSENGTINEIRYNDKDPWPESADGQGKALGLINPMNKPDAGNPENWAAVDPNPNAQNNGFVGNPSKDNDLDGLGALVEYAIGTSDQSFNNSPPLTVSFENNNIQLTHTVDKSAEDVQLIIETTTNLEEWVQIESLGEINIKETDVGDGIVSRSITLTNHKKSALTRHFRIKIVK